MHVHSTRKKKNTLFFPVYIYLKPSPCKVRWENVGLELLPCSLALPRGRLVSLCHVTANLCSPWSSHHGTGTALLPEPPGAPCSWTSSPITTSCFTALRVKNTERGRGRIAGMLICWQLWQGNPVQYLFHIFPAISQASNRQTLNSTQKPQAR